MLTKDELTLGLKGVSEKLEQKQKELNEANKKAMGLKADAEKVAELQKGIDELSKQKNLQQEHLEALELKLKGNKEGGFPEMAVKSVIDENIEALKVAYVAGNVKHFAVKAAVLTSAIANNTTGQIDANISPLAHRTLTMYDLFSKTPVGADQNGTVRYWDWNTATTARAAAAAVEGATFAESTAAWTELSISLEKIGDSIPFSEEFLYDSARFAAELQNFITQNVQIKIDSDLLTGDGTAPNIFGLDTRAAAYTPAASGLQDANYYDLIEKVDEDITTNKGSKFQPNVVIMNISEINKMKLKKDANNNYVMPPFVGANGQEVGGKIVLRNDNVAANVMYVGDSRYGTIYESAEGYSITIGEVDKQFTQDMKTLKARKRMNLLIKNSEQAAWRKVSSISAAITTLGS